MSGAGDIAGAPQARGLRFGIVLSRFNSFVSERLLDGALAALTGRGAESANIDVVRVPGAFEIPLVLKALAAGGKYDALIALGAVIRGDTPHFEYVAGECTRGVAQVGMQYDIPVAFGVLTTDTVEQAIERAGPDSGNKGAEAALAAVEMADLLKKLRA